ncbi:Branched-chain amino acid transport system permease protein OS=Castellaniella defragrans OX=75697 GN=HNR28_003410 PE=3 SV=1 [Castellaniella defragrans]
MDQIILSGLTMGCIYALIASGFILIYDAVGVVNFAQGDLVMLGSYIGVFGVEYLQLGIPLTIFLVVAGCAAIGYFFELITYAPLKDRSIVPVLITTIGAGIFLQNGIQAIAGPNPISIDPFFPVPILTIAGANLSTQNLAIIALTILLLAGQFWLFTKTSLGWKLRATADDKYAARLSGIKVGKMIATTFAISSAISGLAGFFLAPIFLAEPHMGFPLIVKAWIGIVIGGFGSVPGAIAGGVLVGLLDALSASFISSNYKDVITMAILLLVLFWRPQGIFGEPAQEKL